MQSFRHWFFFCTVGPPPPTYLFQALTPGHFCRFLESLCVRCCFFVPVHKMHLRRQPPRMSVPLRCSLLTLLALVFFGWLFFSFGGSGCLACFGVCVVVVFGCFWGCGLFTPFFCRPCCFLVTRQTPSPLKMRPCFFSSPPHSFDFFFGSVFLVPPCAYPFPRGIHNPLSGFHNPPVRTLWPPESRLRHFRQCSPQPFLRVPSFFSSFDPLRMVGTVFLTKCV